MRSPKWFAWHALAQPRQRVKVALRRFSSSIEGGRLLEIGSGPPVSGRYPYSGAHFFPQCEVTMSDIVPEYGHELIDVTTMNMSEAFDAVLCTSVLEHVWEPQRAVDNMRRALRPGGVLFLVLPLAYPLHDEPHDFWRFSEHAIRRLVSEYSSVEIRTHGLRQFPFLYETEAVR